MKKILVTGGTGYIGSHTCIELIDAGFEVIIADNFSNSNPLVLKQIKKITGKTVKVYKCDIRDYQSLAEIFKNENIDSVIHFAGLKSVGESNEVPIKYYDNNISGTINLLKVMDEYNCKSLIFSSSATVYGETSGKAIKENSHLSVTNPYGKTKLLIEEILGDLAAADRTWKIIILRYFNPIGANKTGEIGENPNGIPNNLLPYITQVAVGKLDYVRVFGNDYQTEDGTGVRDYIHIVDLAKGHLAALNKLQNINNVEIYNLGTGVGYSVLEVLTTMEKVVGEKIPYKILARRKGDIASCYANPSKANRDLGWKADLNLEDMCKDSWNWQKKYPNGF